MTKKKNNTNIVSSKYGIDKASDSTIILKELIIVNILIPLNILKALITVIF